MLSTPRPVEGNLPVNAVRANTLPFTRNKSSVPSIKIESIGPYYNPRNAITLFLNVSTFFLKPPDRGAEIATIHGRAEIASDLISPETNPSL